MHTILVVSESSRFSYTFDCLKRDDINYVYIDNIEYAVGYIFAYKKTSYPSVVLIDYEMELIDRFIDICRETSVDLTRFKLLTIIGGEHHVIHPVQFNSILKINDFELQSYFL